VAELLQLEDAPPSGVLVLKSPAAYQLKGVLAPGDVIVQVNGQAVNSPDSLQRVLKKAARSWQIVYKRGNEMLTLTVRM
jgi:S1-C subfamily serine protease